MEQLNIDLSVPRGWHELTDKQLRYVFGLIASEFDSDTIKSLCLCRWSGLKVLHRHGDHDFVCRHNRQEFVVKPFQIAELLPALDWLDDIPTLPVCISRIGRHRAFAADFSEVAFEKFIVCDNLYQGYLATQSDDLLDQLASVLYGHNLSPHNLSPAHRVSVFYWFASVKDYFARRFKHFFQPPAENLLGSPSIPSGSQIQQSVDAMIRALTKGDVTKESEILSLDTHRALTELDAQAREYQEFNAKYPSK